MRYGIAYLVTRSTLLSLVVLICSRVVLVYSLVVLICQLAVLAWLIACLLIVLVVLSVGLFITDLFFLKQFLWK